MSAKANPSRIEARISQLSKFTQPELPWTRVAFSQEHREGRAWLTEQMQSIGLSTHIDEGGNLIGRIKGRGNQDSCLASGSHSDTVPGGGKYDGAAGVIVALEVVSALCEAGVTLRHDFEVIDFLAEEPNRYGLSCIGSRAMAGKLSSADLLLPASDGTVLSEGIAAMGGNPVALKHALRPKMDAFIEMHIEQGVVLESANEDIGIVTNIVGISRILVEIQGRADHAGTTPMDLRRDALVATSVLVTAFEARARTTFGTLVATVGKIDVEPNASNVVPGCVKFILEVRSSDDRAVENYIAWAKQKIEFVCEERDLKLTTKLLGSSNSVAMDSRVQVAIADAAAAIGLKYRAMPSGAGHDAAHIANIAPAGMIFIPCLDGRSHTPEEFASPTQMASGAQTLIDTILALD